MRFLLFNVVVAAALVFLFASDKADLHAAADRAHDAASGLKSKAFEVIGARPAPAIQPTPKPASQPAPANVAVRKTVVATPLQTPAAGVQPAEKSTSAITAADAVKEVQVATRKLVPPLPPAVEKRREEILAEGVVGGKVSAAGGGDKQNFMTASDRKRDLMLLSEEMELFSAKSIAR